MLFTSQNVSAVPVQQDPVVVVREGPGNTRVDVLMTTDLSIHGLMD